MSMSKCETSKNIHPTFSCQARQFCDHQPSSHKRRVVVVAADEREWLCEMCVNEIHKHFGFKYTSVVLERIIFSSEIFLLSPARSYEIFTLRKSFTQHFCKASFNRKRENAKFVKIYFKFNDFFRFKLQFFLMCGNLFADNVNSNLKNNFFLLMIL